MMMHVFSHLVLTNLTILDPSPQKPDEVCSSRNSFDKMLRKDACRPFFPWNICDAGYLILLFMTLKIK